MGDYFVVFCLWEKFFWECDMQSSLANLECANTSAGQLDRPKILSNTLPVLALKSVKSTSFQRKCTEVRSCMSSDSTLVVHPNEKRRFRPFIGSDSQSSIQIMSLSLISPVTQLRALRECFSSTSFWLLSSRIWQKHDSGVLLSKIVRSYGDRCWHFEPRHYLSKLHWRFLRFGFQTLSSLLIFQSQWGSTTTEGQWFTITVVSGRLNVVKGLKRTNQIVDFGRNWHIIGL